MQPSGLNSDGSGTYNAIFELRVVNKKTHAYDPQRGYFGVSVQYQNGRIVKATPFTLTPKQYFDLVRQKKKDKPHRQ